MPFHYLHAYGLAFLELTFVVVALLLLHRLRRVVGPAAFYVGVGAVMIFAQVVTAIGIELVHPVYPGLSVQVGPVIFFTPFITLLLILYIVDGTLEAQRLIWAILFVVGIFFFLAYLTETQITSVLYRIDPRFKDGYVSEIFSLSRLYLMASLLSVLIEFLVMPILYEILRHRNFPLSISVFGALVAAQVMDAFFYQLVTNPVSPVWWDSLRHSFIIRATAVLWCSLLAVIYLKMRDAHRVHESSSRRPLDIVVAFIGAYGQTRKLQANVREWEGRFRRVVENAHDLIFLVSENGTILDANRQASQELGYQLEELFQKKIQELIADGPDWFAIWNALYQREQLDHWSIRTRLYACEFTMRNRAGKSFILEASTSPLFLQESHGVLVVARDITERKELEAELQEKREQLVHSQRMEAVGKLAGGVAHDFNNLLHAIQGSLDHLEKEVGEHPRRKQLLNNIGAATNRAAHLTSQLLGFARGGKYQVKRIMVSDLVRETEELFRPLLGKRGQLKVAIHPDPMRFAGDPTQLQQVLLNVLINAMDALPQENGVIVCRAEPAGEHTPGFDRRPSELEEHVKYIVIRVKDNGCGIDEETMTRIFEPFFTTKQTKGTGLGLAMAYGCMENHNGWIHVQSEVGKGTEFFFFLPCL